MESRYNSTTNESPIQRQLENSELSVGRSAFDFSKTRIGQAIIGALYPVDCFDVVPGENISYSLSAALSFRNPSKRPLLNGFRVYFHGVYNDLLDLWEGSANLLDTGIRSDVSLVRPALMYSIDGTIQYSPYGANACTPGSLLNFLGLPAEAMQLKVLADTDSVVDFPPLRSFQACASDVRAPARTKELNHSNGYFPADCAMAYQRNWRDFYANRNLLMKNKYWFPDNEKHFILSYDCTQAVCIAYGHESLGYTPDVHNLTHEYVYHNLIGLTSFDSDHYSFNHRESVTPESNNPHSVPSVFRDDDRWRSYFAPNLSGLKFRQFRGDRFTTALPFKDLIRGDIPILSLTSEDIPEFIPLSRRIRSSDTVEDSSVSNAIISGSAPRVLYDETATLASISYDYGIPTKDISVPLSQITLNAIRELETMTVFKERMARISNKDSYYNGFIESQFGYKASDRDMRGTYLGGFYGDFNLSEVTQTSESQDSPLGTRAGQGSCFARGTICSDFRVPNFGWFSVYMSIVPDVYYTQGKPRMFDKKTQLDMYLPIFNNLEPQAIKNKELYVSGDASVDEDVFAYEDRYAEYKSRPSDVVGFSALTPEVSAYDTALLMARRFTSTPQLNNLFVTMVPENIDYSVFSVTDEPPFDFQCAFSVRRVFPGPYTAIPGAMSSSLHA